MAAANQGRNLLSRATVLVASVGVMVVTLVVGTAGIASASSVPGGQFELCSRGSFATDVWVNGNLFFDAPQGECTIRNVPFQSFDGPQLETFSFFVHNANPGIEIGAVTYDINQGMGIDVTGSRTNFSWSPF